MFFFFVGGVSQEVRQVLLAGVGRCLRCGSEASLVEYDNVLKLFFVPVWRWPAKDSAIYCDNCGFLMPKGFFREGRPPHIPRPEENGGLLATELRCWSCDRLLDHDFSGFKKRTFARGTSSKLIVGPTQEMVVNR